MTPEMVEELKQFLKWVMEESPHQLCTRPRPENNNSIIPLRNPPEDPMHYPDLVIARYLREKKGI